DRSEDHADRANSVIVPGNRVVDQVRVTVGVDNGDDRNFQASGFGYRVVLAFDVDHKHGAGQALHRANTIEKLHQPRRFTADNRLFLFDVVVDRAVGFHLLDVLEPGDRAFDGCKIGERATQPAFGDEILSA